MFDLTGKTALVTGASGGIGGDIARALHAQGAKVAVSGTRREALDAIAAELGGAPVLPCDLANKDSVEALVPDAEKALGQLDILVTNAGITKDGLFVALKDDDWDQVLNINLTSTFRLARAAVKLMMRKRFGRIIGITSVVGITGNPGQANYTATKAQVFETDEDPYEVAIGPKTLVQVDFHKNVGSRVMRQSTLIFLARGYAVSITVIGGTEDEVGDLVEGLSFASK